MATTPFKWWKLDFNSNFFHSNIDGTNIIANYYATTYSWFARLTSRFTFTQNLDAQLGPIMKRRKKQRRENVRRLYYADLSMSKDVMKGKGTVFLNVLDVFNTRRMRSVTNGENFYSEGNFQMRRRQINLTISYRIKQAKPVGKKKTDMRKNEIQFGLSFYHLI